MHARWNKLIVTLVFLVVTGQALAAALMPCALDLSMVSRAGEVSQSAGIDHAMPGMAHDHAAMGHAMPSDTTIDENGKSSPAPDHGKFDCCDAMGHCLMGGCMLYGASNDLVQVVEELARSIARVDSLQHPSHLTSAHFRPPISA